MLADTTLEKENAALKQEIQQLKTSGNSDRFRNVFDYSRLANKIITPDLEIMMVNTALVRLLGYTSKEDIIGTRILDYSPQEDHATSSLLFRSYR